MSQTIDLTLDGLSCGHCVKRVKESLEQCSDVEQADVTATGAHTTGSVSAEALIEIIKQAGYDVESGHPKAKPLTESSIPPEALAAVSSELLVAMADDDSRQSLLNNMSCASCVTRIRDVLQSIPGVTQARVNLAKRTALVMGSAFADQLVRAVEKAGHGAEAIGDNAKRRKRQQETVLATMKCSRWQAAVALLLGIPVMIWGVTGENMVVTADNCSLWLTISLATLAVMAFAGGHFYRNAWKSLMNGTATMDTLVTLGTGVAWLYSMSVNLWPQWFLMEVRHLHYEASAMIIGPINLGHMLGTRARQRSSKALEKLLDLTPPTARAVTDEGEKNVPLADVQTGMLLRLAIGDRISVDGEIIQGEAWLNEVMLTGEPIPQQKGESDNVRANAVVQDDSVLSHASAVDSHIMPSCIIRMVCQAQGSKSEIDKLADHISSVFVPVVVVIVLVSTTIWHLFESVLQVVYMLVTATTVLVIACPCVLGLATPMLVISGVGRVAKFGVLVRDADALQRASTLDIIVFDKTGVLTEDKPQVVAIKTFGSTDEVLTIRLIAALERGSSHPLAGAIPDKAGDVTLPQVNGFRTLRGLGVSGETDGHMLLLDSQALFNEQQIDTTKMEAEITAQASQGSTPVLSATDCKTVALLTVRDPLCSDSVAAFQRLHRNGYRLVMLTGDDPTTVNAIVKEAGIDEVIAGVLPDGRAEATKRLQSQGCQVVMVGGGINDAPALAQTDVGIAMGGGSNVVIETAVITLMCHSLTGVVDVLSISRVTLHNMKQNLVGAFIYNSIGTPVAVGTLWPFTGTLLNLVAAGVAMVLSSITVVSSVNRLPRFKLKE